MIEKGGPEKTPEDENGKDPDKEELLLKLNEIHRSYIKMCRFLVDKDVTERYLLFDREQYAFDGKGEVVMFCPADDVCYAIGLIIDFPTNKMFIKKTDESIEVGGRWLRGVFIQYTIDLGTGEITVTENQGSFKSGLKGLVDELKEITRSPHSGIDEILTPEDFLNSITVIFDQLRSLL